MDYHRSLGLRQAKMAYYLIFLSPLFCWPHQTVLKANLALCPAITYSGEPYVILVITRRSAVFKANALPTILTLWTLVYYFELRPFEIKHMRGGTDIIFSKRAKKSCMRGALSLRRIKEISYCCKIVRVAFTCLNKPGNAH